MDDALIHTAPLEAAHSPSLQEEFRAQSLARLDRIFNRFLGLLADHLLDLSSRPSLRGNQNLHYDAMSAVRRRGAKLRRIIAEQLEGRVRPGIASEPSGPEALCPRADSELGLVDLQDFEDRLAIKRVVDSAGALYATELETLTLRVAELAGEDPLSLRFAAQPQQVCLALRRALESNEALHALAPMIFDFFSGVALPELGALYRELNAFLVERHLRPDLEEEIAQRGSILGALRRESDAARRRIETEAARDGAVEGTEMNPPLQAANDGGGTAPAVRSDTAAGDLYQSVVSALRSQYPAGETAPPALGAAAGGQRSNEGHKRSNEGGERSNEGGEPTLPADLAEALAALQADPEARAAVAGSRSLRTYLAADNACLPGDSRAGDIAPEGLADIDLVDSLFASVAEELDVSPELKPALAELQIPLTRLALHNPGRFFDEGNPGRAVVDKMTELAAAANFPNRALAGRVRGIVASIVRDFRDDSGVFSAALADIEQLIKQQRLALERNIERVAMTHEGQQTLHLAQQAVDRLIRARLRPPSAPEVIVDLVHHAWRDLLVLTHVKDGPHSRAWRDYVNTLDVLTLWLIEQQQGDGESLQMERELEADTFVDMIEQQISTALPTSVDHQPVLARLREILSGRESVATVPVQAVGAEPGPSLAQRIEARLERLPRLHHWLKRVAQLEQGTWLTYREADGNRRRMQLAWINEQRDRFVFVNERGQKHADLNAVQLARRLSQGMQPPGPEASLPAVERSVFNTLERAQQSLNHAKRHDSLTGLCNREGFSAHLRQALARAQSSGARDILLLVDVDQFAIVNELFDRETGDRTLRELAAALMMQQSRGIHCARLEADRFGILLKNHDKAAAMDFAEKVRGTVAELDVRSGGERVPLTVSIGVTPIRHHYLEVADLLATAQATVAKAKSEGRNCCVLAGTAQPRSSDPTDAREAWCEKIEDALAGERFLLRAQPIVASNPDSDAHPLRHYELLLAVQDDDGNFGSPQDFILAAERYDYVTRIDRWVVDQAFAWIRQLMDEGSEIPELSINISGNSVTNEDFRDHLMRRISELGLRTERLCFEITETGTISNLVKAADFVRAFRGIGCRFSIDDFGTGMASYNYLRELPVDYVKIDGTFVSSINSNRNDYAMTRSINDLARCLGQKTIAECVESEEIAATLREIGVSYLQGWGIGRPRPLSEVREELRAG